MENKATQASMVLQYMRDFGSITPANLASVLGGLFIEGGDGYGKSPDDFFSMFGARRCRNNIPGNAGSVAVVFCIGIGATSGYYEQICIGSNGVILKRNRPGMEANWQNWTEL